MFVCIVTWSLYVYVVTVLQILTETKKQGNLHTLPQHFIIFHVLISCMWIQPSVNIVKCKSLTVTNFDE